MAILQPVKRLRPVLPVKRGRARRSLHFCDERNRNDTRFNLEMAEKLTTISAEECARKWSFDVNKGVPIPGGRFTWSYVDPKSPSEPTSGSAKTGSVTSDTGDVVVEQVTGGQGEVTSHSEVKVVGGQAKETVSISKEGHKEETEERGDEEERKGGGRKRRREEEEEPSSSSSSSSSHATLRQTSITDYVRERKRRRKGGSQHCDNTPTNSPTASRKRPALAPSATTTTDPHQHPHKKVLLQIRA